MTTNHGGGNVKTLLTAVALLASVTAADAQAIYMLNGRATPSVIGGGGGEVYPVIPTPFCHGGPCPVFLAPPLPWLRARVGPYAPPLPLPPEYYNPVVPRSPSGYGYQTCAIAQHCLERNGEWTPPPTRQVPRRGLRSMPSPPISGAPFERERED
jgi:hypothetical protein